MIHQQVEIINKLGLHARAAAKFVTTASTYEAEIHLAHGEQKVNGKSIMGVMMLAASQGSQLDLYVDGKDEEQASMALIELIKNRFNEDK